MLNYTLGTIEASEALIKDLYIDLRAKVNAWSKITQQTPQARMGYVGQHLTSFAPAAVLWRSVQAVFSGKAHASMSNSVIGCQNIPTPLTNAVPNLK